MPNSLDDPGGPGSVSATAIDDGQLGIGDGSVHVPYRAFSISETTTARSWADEARAVTRHPWHRSTLTIPADIVVRYAAGLQLWRAGAAAPDDGL